LFYSDPSFYQEESWVIVKFLISIIFTFKLHDMQHKINPQGYLIMMTVIIIIDYYNYSYVR
jgi:hypothetical protein